ncbi:hypothetical protein [Actinoplanes sp. NBRC 103695]|uniref:hypothetical protein n=1 Tax=Actinoplanes sp. NBRC 103695 TaxID=3032202 RepID=UPI0024A4F147|nr:hypothetical protein [Actinoplanes sp. NBRC 103695]GLY94187.1 hypothetical protein Acsp02_14430 [Actinoplanes sp. NBRC 103695]
MKGHWQDAFRTAADLAIAGFLVVLAALPIVTAGAALLTASRAVDHYLRTGSWPAPRTVAADFRASLLPGLAVVLAGGLLLADVLALRSGQVPGGTPMLVVVSLAGLAAAGPGGQVLVSAARLRLLPAVRDALRTAASHPVCPAVTASVLAVAGTLAVLIHPVLIPVLLGHSLFALHVIARRFGKRPVSDAGPNIQYGGLSPLPPG